jgi:hypothetical protein
MICHLFVGDDFLIDYLYQVCADFVTLEYANKIFKRNFEIFLGAHLLRICLMLLWVECLKDLLCKLMVCGEA